MELKNSDGIQNSFFYILWSKSKWSRNLKLRVPNTILFDDGVPVTWFFTGKQGSILKKSIPNTTTPKVQVFFKKMKKVNKTNIAAVYMYNSNSGFQSHISEKGEEIHYLKDVLESKGYIINYLTFDDLCRISLIPSRLPEEPQQVPIWHPTGVCGAIYPKK